MVFCSLKTHRGDPSGGLGSSYVGLGILVGDF